MTPPLRWPPVIRQDPWRCYDLLLDSLPAVPAELNIHAGMLWTLARCGDGVGLAATPQQSRRCSDLPRVPAGHSPAELAGLVRSWKAGEACVGLAAINALLAASSGAAALATPLYPDDRACNAVLAHFTSRVTGHVVVVGRQPGLDLLRSMAQVTVIDAHPGNDEFPLAAADYLLPQADWVFLSAATLADKSFPRLAELASDAKLVLVGPSTPWLPALRGFGVDYLAGVRVNDADTLQQVVAEGGGNRIYDGAVQHAVLDLAQDEAGQLKAAIAAVFGRRNALKTEMEAWYAQGKARFPGNQELLRIDAELAQLDAHYRQVWDAQQDQAQANG